MKLIIGLGNPGPEYANNRHNVGCMVIDALRKKIGFPEWRKKEKFFSEVSEGVFETEKIILSKPQTFMNLSGKAVRALVDFHHVKLEDLIIIEDDIDLPLGTIRIRQKGSAGTHNGMKSIVESMGTENFPRIRIGIENRDEKLKKKQDLSSYVLSDFHAEEKNQVNDAVVRAVSLLVSIFGSKPLAFRRSF